MPKVLVYSHVVPESRSAARPSLIVSEQITLPGRGVDVALDRVVAAEPRGSVLLLHGYTGSKEDFSPILTPLAEAGYSAYAPDHRGQHESKAEGPFSLDGWADDAATLATVLPGHLAGTPVHLVGHSLGGLVAARTVILHPESWASVTLLCSGPGGHAEAVMLQQMIDGLAQLDITEVYRRKRRLELDNGATTLAPAAEAFMEHRFVSGNPSALSAMSRLLIVTEDQIDALAATGVPARVVYGERDAAWPQSVQDAMAVRLGTRSIVIADADHSPAIEQPTATVEALVGLLAGIPTR